MRDDPYYIVEAREPKHVQNGDDIDSIPVVRLDDMPPLVRPGRITALLSIALSSVACPPIQSLPVCRVYGSPVPGPYRSHSLSIKLAKCLRSLRSHPCRSRFQERLAGRRRRSRPRHSPNTRSMTIHRDRIRRTPSRLCGRRRKAHRPGKRRRRDCRRELPSREAEHHVYQRSYRQTRCSTRYIIGIHEDMRARMNQVENALQSLIRITETRMDGDNDG